MALVPPDSPLRLVPTTLERKAVLFFDGIRYSFHIFDLAAARLTTTLHELSQEQEDKAAIADRIALAMSDAWMLIDSAHRLRELVEQAPRLRKKQPELQLFLRRTANVEVLRNFFQHFRNEIDAFANQAIPLWGTLTWAYVSPETGAPQNYTIAPGTIFNDVTLHTCTFDTVKWKYVERVLLYAGSTKLDLAALFEHVTEFASWYTEWFRIQFPDTDHHCADLHMCMGVKFLKRDANPSSPSNPESTVPHDPED